jgi:CBS domain-containing protein
MQTIDRHHTDASWYDDARVEDVMHPGVLTCPPETSLSTVAKMMATYSVHAIVVTDLDSEGDPDERAWGIVSSLDLTRACVAGADGPTAGGVASTEVLTVSPGDPLASAAQLMAAHGTEHVVVADLHGRPVGVVSTSDVATVIARP